MKSIQEHIARKQAEIAKHPFLTELQPDSSLERMLYFAPLTAFWAMSFQDVIRMNTERVRDPELKKIIGTHMAEDVGHDLWFLEDLEVIGKRNVDLGWLYGQECRPTREATYAIASEVFRAEDDIQRVVLTLTLEGAGHVMFGRVTKVLHEAGYAGKLRYFAPAHLDVEKGHDLFADEVQRRVNEISLTDAQRAAGIALVDRVFAAFHLLADGLKAGRTAAAA